MLVVEAVAVTSLAQQQLVAVQVQQTLPEQTELSTQAVAVVVVDTVVLLLDLTAVQE
jgi:hypothetical protein